MITLVLLFIGVASAVKVPFSATSGPASIHLANRVARAHSRSITPPRTANAGNVSPQRRDSPSHPTATFGPSTSAAGEPSNAAGLSNPQNSPGRGRAQSPARIAAAGGAAGRNPNAGAARPGQPAQGGVRVPGDVERINRQAQVQQEPTKLRPAGRGEANRPTTATPRAPPVLENVSFNGLGLDELRNIFSRLRDDQSRANLAKTNRAGRVISWEHKQTEDAVIGRIIRGRKDIRPDWIDTVGINRPVTKDGRTAMHVAAEKGDAQAIEDLAELKANPNPTEATRGKTPMFNAAETGNPNSIKALVVAGGNVNHADKYGFTPMHVAATNDRAGNIKALEEWGGNVNAQHNQKLTPLDLAGSVGGSEAERELIGLHAKRGAALEREKEILRQRATAQAAVFG